MGGKEKGEDERGGEKREGKESRRGEGRERKRKEGAPQRKIYHYTTGYGHNPP